MERRPRRLVPVTAMPPGLRLMFGAFAMEQIGVIADQERGLDHTIRGIIGEAIRYTPPFAERIAEACAPAEELIRYTRAERGRVHNAPSSRTYIDQLLAGTAGRKIFGTSQLSDPGATARELARQVAQILHPDSTKATATKADDPTDIQTRTAQETLMRSRQAAEAGDVIEVQSMALQSTPRVLLGRVRALLHRGYTFEQIAEEHPTLTQDMAVLHEMAYAQFGLGGSLKNPQLRRAHAIRTPEAAQGEAKRMKRRDDRLARYMAFSHIYGVFTDLQELNTDPVVADHLTNIAQAMQQAGGIVGGLDEFFERNGPYRQIPRLQSRLEEFIEAVPEHLVTLTQQVLGEEDTEPASVSLLSSVVNVRRAGYSYKNAIEDAANPDRRTKTIKQEQLTTNFKKENTIFKQNKYEKYN